MCSHDQTVNRLDVIIFSVKLVNITINSKKKKFKNKLPFFTISYLQKRDASSTYHIFLQSKQKDFKTQIINCLRFNR